MICIHPTVTQKFSSFSTLCARTGLRAMVGNRYYRLVPESQLPKAGPSKPSPSVRASFQPTTGGDAA
jgi:hypothetical protein